MVEEQIEIPQGLEINVQKTLVTVKGPKGENSRNFKVHNLTIEKKDNMIIITGKKLALARTIKSHINNMFKGISEGYEKRMKIVFSHFPITATVKGDKLEIKNFVGEKTPRFAKIKGNTKIDIKGQYITITGIDKEAVGQTAANFLKATKIKKRDPRVFQDGIYPALE